MDNYKELIEKYKDKLSKKELTVLENLSSGMNSKQIAIKMNTTSKNIINTSNLTE